MAAAADWKAKAMAFVKEAEHPTEQAPNGEAAGGEGEEVEEEGQAAEAPQGAAAAAAAMPPPTAPGGAALVPKDPTQISNVIPGTDPETGPPKAQAGDANEPKGQAKSAVSLMPEEFKFPPWDPALAADQAKNPGDFGKTWQVYAARRDERDKLPEVDESTLDKKQQEERQRQRDALAARKRAVNQKLQGQRRHYEDKEKKTKARAAEKERGRLERERDKQIRALEREAARVAVEEDRIARREQLAKDRFERYQEMEGRRKDRSHGSMRRRWQERSTVQDERLPSVPVPPGVTCQWDKDNVLPPTDLLMAWNFITSNGVALCCPRVTLGELVAGLMAEERALELTDVHVALMRVILDQMDTRGVDWKTSPSRLSTLTNLTWPYLAAMHIQENSLRLTEKEMEVSDLLLEQEYASLSPVHKLQLLTFLCDECCGTPMIKSSLDDTKVPCPTARTPFVYAWQASHTCPQLFLHIGQCLTAPAGVFVAGDFDGVEPAIAAHQVEHRHVRLRRRGREPVHPHGAAAGARPRPQPLLRVLRRAGRRLCPRERCGPERLEAVP